MKELLYKQITDKDILIAKLAGDNYFSNKLLTMISQGSYDHNMVFAVLEDMNITGTKISDGFNYSHYVLGHFVESVLSRDAKMVEYINNASIKRNDQEKAVLRGAIKAKLTNQFEAKLLFHTDKNKDEGMSL